MHHFRGLSRVEAETGSHLPELLILREGVTCCVSEDAVGRQDKQRVHTWTEKIRAGSLIVGIDSQLSCLSPGQLSFARSRVITSRDLFIQLWLMILLSNAGYVS